MRRALAAAAAALALGAAAAEPLRLVEPAPGVFVHQGAVAEAAPGNGGDIANIGFVVGERSVAVIDPGGAPAVGEALLAALRERTDLPVSHVMLTHMHPDHVFGASAFARAAEAPEVVAHHRLPRALAARAAAYRAGLARALGEDVAAEVEIVLPDVLVEAERAIDLGERTLRLRAWPTAHTDNDLTVLDEATATLFAGDLVFLDHLPALDGDLRGWLRVMDALSEIEAERVVPGHGPAVAPWPEALEPQRRYLEALAASVRAQIASGATLREAVDAASSPEGWSLADAFHRRNVTAAFAELEWE